MLNAKTISTPLAAHFKFSSGLCPLSDDNIDYISWAPYSSAIGLLMYTMVYTKSNLIHAVSVVSRHVTNLDKEHWKTVQWIFKNLRGSTNACSYFGRNTDRVIRYINLDYVEDLDKRK